ncbi:Zinc finger cchc-type protein [Lasiodiplodia theobromae]|uniref:Zinc finger cchc-type protein n=1 Tax=Lasiodiplodia theobromae TaxID=45133 RepID=UPI0015C322D7|nr:Zinc finger cchc-type protein [Lasiodiplodia theobromae]KAF4534667.1 Zinc finger cchc-type protein [Lasiodiplodia theobromae]
MGWHPDEPGARTTTAPEVPTDDWPAEQNQELGDKSKRLRETSEAMQVKMEEYMKKTEKQMTTLVESMRRNLSSQSQINATYADML